MVNFILLIVCIFFYIIAYKKEINKKTVVIYTNKEYNVWIAKLLKRGMMEHETSYGKSIEIPGDLKEDLEKFIEEAEFISDYKGDWRCSECDYQNNPEGISFCFNCFQPK